MTRKKTAEMFMILFLIILSSFFVVETVEIRGAELKIEEKVREKKKRKKKKKTEKKGKKKRKNKKNKKEKKKNKKKNKKNKKKNKKNKKKVKIKLVEEEVVENFPRTDEYKPDVGTEKTRESEKKKRLEEEKRLEKEKRLEEKKRLEKEKRLEEKRKQEEKKKKEIIYDYGYRIEEPIPSSLYTVFCENTDKEGRIVFQEGEEVRLPERGFIGYKKTGENSGELFSLNWSGAVLDDVRLGKKGRYVLYVSTEESLTLQDLDIEKKGFYIEIKIK